MASPDVPNLTSLLALAFAAGVAALVSWFERRRTKKGEVPPDTSGKAGQVLAGSIIDTRLLQNATDGMGKVQREIERFREQQHDDSRALRTAIEDMTHAVKRNTEAQESGAVTPRELAGLLAQIRRAGE